MENTDVMIRERATNAKLWSGLLEHLPRLGEAVAVDDPCRIYRVVEVFHVIPANSHKSVQRRVVVTVKPE